MNTDTFNKFFVGAVGDQVALMLPPPTRRLSVQDARLLAAYLVVMADWVEMTGPSQSKGPLFNDVLDAVRNTVRNI